MKRIVSLVFCFFILVTSFFSQVYSSQEPIPANHWIYDALYRLNSERSAVSVLDNAPLTVQELYSNFELIDKDELSDAGKILYEKTEKFFEKKKYNLDFDNIKFTTGLKLSPAAAVKTNNNIDWSCASSYTAENKGEITTGKIEKPDVLVNGAANTLYSTGLAIIPFVFDFNDIITLDFEPYIGTSNWVLTDKNWAMNIPLTINQEDWMFTPYRAFGSTGKHFGNWGINGQIGISGLQIGRSRTGSVIYNSTFQTDSFCQLNLYSPKIKYNLDFIQIDIQRFMYVHYFELVTNPKFKLGVVEGTMVKGPVELKWFNPLVIMHSFLGWRLYRQLDKSDEGKKAEQYYGETDFCAYLGISFDYTPCKYLRLYLLWGQNELMDFQESLSPLDYTQSFPDSFGIQLGADLTLPYRTGYFLGNFEGIYTTPFCYIKQTKESSLVRIREWNNYPSYGLGRNGSWIGTPFGPDALGFNLSFGYEETRKWKAELEYLFLAHGTNSVNLFYKTVEKDGEEYYAYYPTVMLTLGTASAEETRAMRTHKLTGIIQYTNRIGINGEYHFTDSMSVGGNVNYTFIFNHRAVKGAFDQGLEFTLNYKWDIF